MLNFKDEFFLFKCHIWGAVCLFFGMLILLLGLLVYGCRMIYVTRNIVVKDQINYCYQGTKWNMPKTEIEPRHGRELTGGR